MNEPATCNQRISWSFKSNSDLSSSDGLAWRVYLQTYMKNLHRRDHCFRHLIPSLSLYHCLPPTIIDFVAISH